MKEKLIIIGPRPHDGLVVRCEGDVFKILTDDTVILRRVSQSAHLSRCQNVGRHSYPSSWALPRYTTSPFSRSTTMIVLDRNATGSSCAM